MEEIFRNLVESGVEFYYQDATIEYSTVTDIVILDDEFFKVELNNCDKYKISMRRFKNYHSKDNVNFHNWQLIRNFDALLNEHIE